MARRSLKLLSVAALVTVGAAGYFLYSVFAVQGQGALAQQPLNGRQQVPPAFIMAVDDSGSMTFEGLYLEDEQAYWGTSTACLNGQASCPNGFFSAAGVMRTSGRGLYYHIIPNGIRLDQTGNTLNTNTPPRLAIPPLDLFGFARSPHYNKQWFDPTVEYHPWLQPNGDQWPNASVSAAPSDPRQAGTAGTRGPNPVVTYDFTADMRSQNKTANYFAFRFQPGMRLPAGTEYYMRSDRHGGGCGGLGTTANTRNTWVTLTSAHLVTNVNNLPTGTGNNNRGGGCEILVNHFPATIFLPLDATPPLGFNLANRVTVANAGGPGVSLYKYELRASNFSDGAAYEAVIQNFANWYTYYGNRNRAMIAAMTHSLISVNNMRIGYFSINRRSGDPPGMAGGDVTMRDMNAGERPELYESLYTLAADGGTPNRSATVFMGDQFKRTDDGAPIQNACQINAGMLFTDGYTNESPSGGFGNAYRNIGDTDGALPRPLGGNTNGNTIADIAYSFYAGNPLRTDLPSGEVPRRQGCEGPNPPLWLDCQTNLHMNFYGITLGTPGEIYEVNQAATADPYTNLPDWSVTGTQNLSPRNVDDIWHATLNTRGAFINAQTPADVTRAMRRIIEAINEGLVPSGSLALTGARVGVGSLTVTPSYEVRNEGTDWFGRLQAHTATVASTGAIEFTPEWEASGRIPDAASRRIVLGSGNSGGSEFSPTSVGDLGNLCGSTPGISLCSTTGADLAALGGTTPLTLVQAVDYLRGDQTLEVGRGNGDRLRHRTTRLGNIVNSNPVVSAPTDDYGYRTLPAPYGGSYANYLSTTSPLGKRGRRPMVFVGANDGMLHGFDGRTGTVGGVERFAFVPRTALGHMGNLLFPYVPADGLDQKFRHRYFVDGAVTVSDAYWGSGWNTVLVGASGAGGRGAFALNVSGISQVNGTFANSDVLWELSDLNTDLSAAIRNNIGFVLGRPVIVPVKTGSASGPVTWRAIFGNGYNSQSQRAVLFMVDLDGGALTNAKVTMIEAVEPGAPSGNNGLGNIVVVDRWTGAPDGSLGLPGRDGFADTVYAADQKGAIWKFDIRDASPADVSVPLFTTLRYSGGSENDTRQPILGGLTASAAPGGGVMLYFGTGSFSFEGDAIDTTTQSLYGVVDRTQGLPAAAITRSTLVEQRIVDTVTVDGRLARRTTSETPSAFSNGWYLDLPEGERFVGYPRVESGIVFMPTFAATAIVACGSEGRNWLYGLDALTGGAGLSSVRFDTPAGTSPGAGTGAVSLGGDGTAPVKDVEVLTTPRLGPLGEGASADDLADALAAQCSMLVQVAGAPPLYMPRACGRQSWRQIQ